jgi:hypothetical protein
MLDILTNVHYPIAALFLMSLSPNFDATNSHCRTRNTGITEAPDAAACFRSPCDNVRMLDLRDIAPMKLKAIANGEVKKIFLTFTSCWNKCRLSQ